MVVKGKLMSALPGSSHSPFILLVPNVQLQLIVEMSYCSDLVPTGPFWFVGHCLRYIGLLEVIA